MINFYQSSLDATFNKSINVYKSVLSPIEYSKTSEISHEIIDKMKRLVKSSNRDITQVFANYDEFDTGFITNLEFRNVMRKLNIGLSTADIDAVLNITESVNGAKINWKEFC